MGVRLLFMAMTANALLLTACTAKVDRKAVEAKVREQLSGQGLQVTELTCPDTIKGEPGAVFTCQLELGTKHKYELDVTLIKEDPTGGKITLTTSLRGGRAVVLAKLVPPLRAEMSETLGAAATVECGDDPVRFLDAQGKLACDFVIGDVKSKLSLTFDEKLTPTDWELEPPLLGTAKLEAVLTPGVRDKAAMEVKVDCGPAAFHVRPPDGVIWCRAATAKRTAKLKVEIDGKLEVQRWELLPPDSD